MNANNRKCTPGVPTFKKGIQELPYRNEAHKPSLNDRGKLSFDEDDDLRSKYLEKERALKKINEELEKKSSEIFSKLERMRSQRV